MPELGNNETSQTNFIPEYSSGRSRWHTALWLAAVVTVIVLVGLVVWGLIDGWLRCLAIWARPFAPFSTAAIALVASVIALLSYRQRRHADNRAEWWRRVQAAIDLLTEDEKIGRRSGLVLMGHLFADNGPTKKDLRMLMDVGSTLISEVIDRVTTSSQERAVNTDYTGDPSAGQEAGR